MVPKTEGANIVLGMPSGTIEHVKQDASRVVRHQPLAHADWQFSYRNARFRSAIGNFVSSVYALDVERFTDEQFQLIELLVRAVTKVVEVHLSGLGEGVRDVVDREYFRPILRRLEVAVEGLEQGLAPDPAKRPTDDQLMEQFNAGLRRAKLA